MRFLLLGALPLGNRTLFQVELVVVLFSFELGLTDPI
jgi:hypothetical protein